MTTPKLRCKREPQCPFYRPEACNNPRVFVDHAVMRGCSWYGGSGQWDCEPRCFLRPSPKVFGKRGEGLKGVEGKREALSWVSCLWRAMFYGVGRIAMTGPSSEGVSGMKRA